MRVNNYLLPLLSICQLNADMVEDILEQREAASHLGNFVRDKFLRRLQSLGEGRVYLEELFRSIDTNKSNTLSRREFQVRLFEDVSSFIVLDMCFICFFCLLLEYLCSHLFSLSLLFP